MVNGATSDIIELGTRGQIFVVTELSELLLLSMLLETWRTHELIKLLYWREFGRNCGTAVAGCPTLCCGC